MKYVDIRDLPLCSFSPDCLRLMDDLELPATRPAFERLAYIHDFQDERRLRQLRSHVSSCSTCSAVLTEARRERTQQRMMLYYFLLANEKQVPATTDSIFAALRSEQVRETDAILSHHSASQKQASVSSAPSPERPQALFPLPFHTRNSQRHGLFRNLLTLVTVVAVILAAVGLLNYLSDRSLSLVDQKPHPRQPDQPGGELGNTGWDSVIVGLTFLSATGLAKGFTLYNFDTTDDHLTSLISSHQAGTEMAVDGVSSDGQHLLYNVVSPSRQRVYTTLAFPARLHELYNVSADQVSNAIWMDSAHVLIQNTQGGVVELDASNGAFLHSWSLKAGRLLFYHQPFLYFTGAEQLTASVLYRIDLSRSDTLAQQIIMSAPNTHFWLSPDGTSISYMQSGPAGVEDIYTVGNDGTRAHLVFGGVGVPIGYAAGNALMVLQQAGSRLQVIKVDVTLPQNEQIVFADAAPQAISLCGHSALVMIIAICEQNIALDPYGQGLLIHAYYANGSDSLIYDNLMTGLSRNIWNLPAHSNVQLPGWSKMSSGAHTTIAPSTMQATSSQGRVVRPLAGLVASAHSGGSEPLLSLCA